jgi:opacity protein-like surface antigen
MKTTTLVKTLGIGCLLGTIPALNAAEPKTWYFHAGAGLNLAQDVDVKNGGSAELDLGTRLDVGVGYNLTKNIALQFDGGWLWNGFKDVDASLSHIPFIVNGIYTYQIKDTKWELYGGAGIGGTYSILDIEDAGINDSDGQIAFAWQAMAGARYNFRPNMSLGLGYKYLATTASDYELAGGTVELDVARNHSFMVTFHMKF